MSTPFNPLLQATHIWIDEDKGEMRASLCLRWADVRSIEHSEENRSDEWEYRGAIAFIVTTEYEYHILGSYDTWMAMWQRYTASAQAMLLAHN
jgi:hypothetical protein